MGKLFDSLKESIRSKLEQPAGRRRSAREKASVGGTIEKEAEQAPPERAGEIVGHSSSG